ncbi:MAG TPA: alkaline phosphatase family protein [Thermoplasmata archaeon]|nr:alkaline phosphatase family protein [Thermoplasmata archaeon]
MPPKARPTSPSPPRTAPGGAASPLISKIVVVFQENHTFDNYFGSYPGADGTSGRPVRLPVIQGGTPSAAPTHSATLTPADLTHSWASAHADYDSGKMDGFVYSERSLTTMTYFDRSDLPRYWALADSYVLCDRYFTSAMTESAPNHLFLVAGTNGGIIDDHVPSSLPFPPIFAQLDAQGISWKVYGFSRWYQSFEYVQKTPAAKSRFLPSAQFAVDVTSRSLADVSWIIGAVGGDEHPPANVRAGQDGVLDGVINPLGQSPYWPSLALFLTWDCYGGFYDHVPPTQVDAFGYGFRVPCLVVSPYARQGVVDHVVNDHTSILKFIETHFGLNPLSTRDAQAGDLSEAFDFTTPARSFSPL